VYACRRRTTLCSGSLFSAGEGTLSSLGAAGCACASHRLALAVGAKGLLLPQHQGVVSSAVVAVVVVVVVVVATAATTTTRLPCQRCLQDWRCCETRETRAMKQLKKLTTTRVFQRLLAVAATYVVVVAATTTATSTATTTSGTYAVDVVVAAAAAAVAALAAAKKAASSLRTLAASRAGLRQAFSRLSPTAPAPNARGKLRSRRQPALNR